jgi:hypothetical protein
MCTVVCVMDFIMPWLACNPANMQIIELNRGKHFDSCLDGANRTDIGLCFGRLKPRDLLGEKKQQRRPQSQRSHTSVLQIKNNSFFLCRAEWPVERCSFSSPTSTCRPSASWFSPWFIQYHRGWVHHMLNTHTHMLLLSVLINQREHTEPESWLECMMETEITDDCRRISTSH